MKIEFKKWFLCLAIRFKQTVPSRHRQSSLHFPTLFSCLLFLILLFLKSHRDSIHFKHNWIRHYHLRFSSLYAKDCYLAHVIMCSNAGMNPFRLFLVEILRKGYSWTIELLFGLSSLKIYAHNMHLRIIMKSHATMKVIWNGK